MKVPFVVYADSDTFIEPIQNRCQPDPRESYTAPYQKHTPSSFCYYIKCFDDDVYSKQPVIVTKEKEDDDIAQIFVDMQISKRFIPNLKRKRKRYLTKMTKGILRKQCFVTYVRNLLKLVKKKLEITVI